MRRFPLSNVPLCTVKGCPFPSDPDWHIPFCGHGLVGHHQHIPKLSLDPNAKIQAFICPRCHDRVDNGLWSNHIKTFPDGSVHYFILDEHGKTMAERVIGRHGEPVEPEAQEAAQDEQQAAPAVVARSKSEAKRLTAQTGHAVTVFTDGPLAYVDLPQDDPYEPVFHSPRMGIDWSSFSDEQLVVIYQDADERQGFAFMDKCHAIHTYRMRHDDWLESAYDLFHASRRTLYAYSNVYEVCATSDTHIVENIGPLTDSRSLMQFIGRKSVEEGRVALEAAVAHLAEFGEPPTVKALQHRLGQEAKPEEGCHHSWKCELCGATR